MGTVESLIGSMLQNFRRLIEENRHLNEEYQKCAKLIRTNTEFIFMLENEIKMFKDENQNQQSNVFKIGGIIFDERGISRQLVEKNAIKRESLMEVEYFQHSETPCKQSHLTYFTKYLFWTIFFSHTVISLIKNS